MDGCCRLCITIYPRLAENRGTVSSGIDAATARQTVLNCRNKTTSLQNAKISYIAL